MNRVVTNFIRNILDEYLPPKLRDARWFMYPMFYIWYKGKNIKKYMDFKSFAYTLTDFEFSEIYRNITSMAEDRPTDLNNRSINLMISKIDKNAKTLLDVGCGRGYWLNYLEKEKSDLNLFGCDLKDNLDNLTTAKYVKGSVYKLPFEDKSIDIITCHHTIEHLRDVKSAIIEMKRVAKKQIMIVVPRQRYYFYTMDLHLNFYPIASYLEKEMEINDHLIEDIHGDWVYIGNLDDVQ